MAMKLTKKKHSELEPDTSEDDINEGISSRQGNKTKDLL